MKPSQYGGGGGRSPAEQTDPAGALECELLLGCLNQSGEAGLCYPFDLEYFYPSPVTDKTSRRDLGQHSKQDY
jgi:hypothetical protein